MKNNQEGFSFLPVILVVVLIAVVGGVGYYVYNAQKDDQVPDRPVASTQQTAEEAPETVPKEEDSWLLFESSGYSLRVPDGWQGLDLEGNLFMRGASDVVYKKGEKAKVEATEGGWDGASAFAVIYPHPETTNRIPRQGDKVGTVTTNDGLVAHKYIYKQIDEPEAMGYQKGDTAYKYYFDADGKYVVVSHVVSAGQTDQSELVERVVKTVKVK